MKTCFLFPGQGSQYPGMAKDLWEASAGVREMFTQASDASGMDTKKLLFESTADDLKATDKTQVAITLASLCSSAYLRERGVRMEGCAGFSLGEYAALCESGVITADDVFPIVKLRGDIMEKTARAMDGDRGAAGMSAVLGLPAEKVAEIIGSMDASSVYVSNHNSPSQAVISGTAQALAMAEKALKAAGAKRIVRLSVSGPFHSPLMERARADLEAALAAYTFSDPRMPVYSNVTGKRISTGAEARRLCAEQLVSTVRWVAVEESLRADGFERFLEAGPGTVLTGLMRALSPELRCAPAGTAETAAKAAEDAA